MDPNQTAVITINAIISSQWLVATFCNAKLAELSRSMTVAVILTILFIIVSLRIARGSNTRSHNSFLRVEATVRAPLTAVRVSNNKTPGNNHAAPLLACHRSSRKAPGITDLIVGIRSPGFRPRHSRRPSGPGGIRPDAHGTVSRLAVQQPDHRHLHLLRLRVDRPYSRFQPRR